MLNSRSRHTFICISQRALVSSKLDYLNIALSQHFRKDIARLEHVQNCFARVVTKASRFNLSLSILKQLHWLPVKFCIHFKICTIMFWTPRKNQPAYHTDLLAWQKCSKYLCSTNSIYFLFPLKCGMLCLCRYKCPNNFTIPEII